ncbi:hypothetical protein BJ944DRAFT_286547 [Cunninghamella echinulata]|nr:hypothetical protein BJ944DRAFT_286547 [Cunninghamella echinulata]
MEIENSVVLIFGGTSGIGKELTIALTSMGANVLYSGTSKEKGLALASQLNPSKALFYQCDITHWNRLKESFNIAKNYFNKSVDIVISIAGILDSSDILHEENEQDGIYRTIQVNLTSAIKITRLAIQYFLKEKKPGCIIHTSSIYGFCGAPLAPMYSATKHGIIGLTKSYGILLKSSNIRVNSVAPSFIETPMLPATTKKTAATLGYVTMAECINGYIKLIEDTSLNGEILTITVDGSMIDSRLWFSFEDKLIQLTEEKQQKYRDQLFKSY